MSFLDELDDGTPCLASFCPQCKDNPEAIALRAAEAAKSRRNMTAPLRQAIAQLQPARPQARERDTTEWMRK